MMAAPFAAIISSITCEIKNILHYLIINTRAAKNMIGYVFFIIKYFGYN